MRFNRSNVQCSKLRQSLKGEAKPHGAEFGIRTNFIPKLNSTFALWWLQSSQEQVFSGHDGTTTVKGRSQRYGIEWSNYYKPTDWLTLDADLALNSACYAVNPTGETNTYVPNSVGRVICAGATLTFNF
jgi:hypothetical protein